MATTATAVVISPMLEQSAKVQEHTPVPAALTSGQHLSEAIQEATAADAEMVPVPLNEQHVTALPGPGVNAPCLPGGQSSITSAPPTAEVPAAKEEEDVLQLEASTASVVAVAASATAVASEQSADVSGLLSVSAFTAAAATTAVVAVAADNSHQDAADARPTSSEAVVAGASQAGLVSIMAAASTLAEAPAAVAAEGEVCGATADSAAPRSRQQSVADGQAGSTGDDAESSLLSDFTASDEHTDSTGDEESSRQSSVTSQHPRAQQSDGAQQAGVATDDEPWSISAQGQHAADSRGNNEDESSSLASGSGMSVLPNVKQSVRRLEDIHAAMRKKV